MRSARRGACYVERRGRCGEEDVGLLEYGDDRDSEKDV